MSGIIYKLFIDGCDYFYIGATMGTMRSRLAVHRYNVKTQKNAMYKVLYDFSEGKPSKIKFEILDVIEDADLHTLHLKEFETIQEHIVNHGTENCLNTKFKNDCPLTIGNIKQTENITKYNNKYYHSTNKHNMLRPIECDTCKKTLSNVNYSRHLTSRKHQLQKRINEEEKEEQKRLREEEQEEQIRILELEFEEEN